MLTAGSTPTIQGLTVEQAEAVVRLSCLPAFRDLIAKVQADEVGAGVPLPGKRTRSVSCTPEPPACAPVVPGPPVPKSMGSARRDCPTVSPQQFGIWLDSSSPEQTVPYLWSEESPASEPRQAPSPPPGLRSHHSREQCLC